jgi:hypothetical protein
MSADHLRSRWRQFWSGSAIVLARGENSNRDEWDAASAALGMEPVSALDPALTARSSRCIGRLPPARPSSRPGH